jgi:hypothetical protein
MSNYQPANLSHHATIYDYTLGGLTGILSVIVTDMAGWQVVGDLAIKGVAIPLLAVITGTLGGALGKWMLVKIKIWIDKRFNGRSNKKTR